jgi:hypothetical protein
VADNTQINLGSGGDLIATDDVGGVKFQQTKLVDGTLNSSDPIPGDSTDGLWVNVKAIAALAPGTNNIGDVDIASTPTSAADGGALPAVQEVVAGFDGVNTQVLKTNNVGVLQVGLSNAGDSVSVLSNGRVTVSVPGTAVALGTSAACAWVTVTALPTNQGLIHVGASGVLATAGAETGVPLAARESVTVPTQNVDLVFVDAVVAAEGASYLAGVL